MSTPERWLRRQAAIRPGATAIDHADGHAVDFATLDRAVDALAAAVPPSSRPLAAELDEAGALARLALAAPRAGRALLPVNPALTPERRAGLLALAGLDRALTALPLADPATPCPGDRALNEAAVHLIIATSGSTGAPKGAMLSGANLAAAVRASRQRLDLAPGDVWLGCLPLVHIGGVMVLFRTLEAGATTRLYPRFSAEAIADDLECGRVSHVSLVPAMLDRLLGLGCRPAARLRHALIGGAGLPVGLAARARALGWPLRPSYGLSEAGSQIATCPDIDGWHPGLAGAPLPGIEIATAANGRLRLRGPMVMTGYLAPDLAPGHGLDAHGWFETGDLGGLDALGRLVVRGRADDMLISGGENVHPAEIEALAGRCPGIRAIAVVGRPDPTWGDLVVAVVVGGIDEASFLGWCRAHLPPPLRPRRMIHVAALPLNSTGKPDRAALRALAAEDASEDARRQIES